LLTERIAGVIAHPASQREEATPWSVPADDAEHAPAAPPPTENETALIDTVLTSLRATSTTVRSLRQKSSPESKTLNESRAKTRRRVLPSMAPWIVPAVIALAVGGVLTILELRTIRTQRPTSALQGVSTDAALSVELPSRPLLPSMPTLTTPRVARSRVIASLPTREQSVWPEPSAAPAVVNRANAPSARHAPIALPTSNATAPSLPIANLPLSSATIAPVTPVAPTFLDRTSAAAASPAADVARAPNRSAGNMLEEDAVKQALGRYITAFDELNVSATVQIWPSVDRRAVTRAFASLKSQDVTFESCDVKALGSSATARCRGTVRYVGRVGNPVPHTEPEQWLFKMLKFGSEWKIDQVTASQESVSHAASTSRH
jgi:hypothetical protein